MEIAERNCWHDASTQSEKPFIDKGKINDLLSEDSNDLYNDVWDLKASMLINVKLRHAMKLGSIVKRLNSPNPSGMYPAFKPSLGVSNIALFIPL